jgi:hypothetical protein
MIPVGSGQERATAASRGRGFRLASPPMATALGVLTLAMLATLVLQAALAGQLTGGLILANIDLPLTMGTIGAVGLVVARHQPGNPTGWLLLAVALCFVITFNAGQYIGLRYTGGHPGLPLGPVALLLTPALLAAIPLFALVIMLFPDGRLPSRAWAWFTWACLAATALGPLGFEIATISVIAGHHVKILPDGQLAAIEHSAGSTAGLGVVARVVFGAVAVFWVGSIARQVQNWRRSAGERRQQLKWLLSGAVVFAVLGVPSLGVTSSLWKVMTLGFAALPVAIGIGILKYRLYEIDRIISRTLAYAIVTGLLVGVYAGLVLLATRVLTVHTPVAVAAATLAAAALFTPLRRRVQHLVDRRFNRARYDAEQTVAAFAARLQDAVDLDTVRTDLAGAVHAALEPAHVSVWIAGAGR